MNTMLVASDFVKIHVAVPVTHADAIRAALGSVGAGKQGNYAYCSGSIRQIGRFRPTVGATPAIGSVGTFQEVEEELIETICHKDIVRDVVDAVKAAHPYEEPAIDIMPRLEIKDE